MSNRFILHALEQGGQDLGEAGLGGSLVNDILTGKVDIVAAPAKGENESLSLLAPLMWSPQFR